jgi:hypothetical protein
MLFHGSPSQRAPSPPPPLILIETLIINKWVTTPPFPPSLTSAKSMDDIKFNLNCFSFYFQNQIYFLYIIVVNLALPSPVKCIPHKIIKRKNSM